MGHDVQEGFARQAVKATGSACHDGTDAAFDTRRTSWWRVGNADRLLVNVVVVAR